MLDFRMSTVVYPSDQAIVQHLSERIAASRRGETLGHPSDAHIAELLSVAYAASLESDEHRPTKLSLLYAPTNYPNNYHLRRPVPLSPGALVRLAAGLDAARSTIVVGGGEELQVMGVWHGGNMHAGGFFIRVFGTGVLLVTYEARLILTYRRGSFVRYSGNFSEVNDTGALLNLPGTSHQEVGHNDHAVACRLRIVEEMVRLGHGGTLLIVPPGYDWRSSVASEGFPAAGPQVRIRDAEVRAFAMWMRRQAAYQILSGADAPVDAGIRAQHAGDLLGGYELRHDLEAELVALAHLTATDGMVLVLPDLTLLGFGVFFTLREPGCTLTVHDPYEAAPREVNKLADLGGARHQSAAFAAAVIPGALAIVASSDGAVTAMRRASVEQPLVIHKHLELRLPEYTVYQ